MSNDNEFERLFKLQATINKLVLDGKRHPDELSALLQAFMEKAPIIKVAETLLEDMEQVTVVIDTTVNLNNLKITEASNVIEALWVHGGFKKILKKVKGSVPTSVTMKPRRLKKNADGSQIRGALPEECGIDPTSFVYMLVTELKKVTSGKESNVLNKNSWCLFMVVDLKVLVHWYSSESWWRVKVCEDYIYVEADIVVYSGK